MTLKRIKFCPAQSPITPWWEDVEGKEVKGGREHFRAHYHGLEVIVLQFRYLPLTFLSSKSLQQVTIVREDDDNVWVEVVDSPGHSVNGLETQPLHPPIALNDMPWTQGPKDE